MATKHDEKHGSDAGFFEKNFLKLKDGQHLEYMLSRIILFCAGITVGLYYLHDSIYRHSEDGIPDSILFAVAVIFGMNGLRKMVRGLIKLREAAWDNSVVERPHNPGESWLMRVGFRFPLGQRRHLVSAMTLAAEGLASLLVVMSFVAICINEGLFMLSWQFPFVAKPFLISDMTFPANLWLGLVITAVARILSYINGMIFLTKIPQVRKTIAETLKGMYGAEHLLLYFPTKAYEIMRGIGTGSTAKPCDECEAEKIAERILSEYPEHVISAEHKKELHPELVLVLCKEDDPKVLVDFLRRRIDELKKRK